MGGVPRAAKLVNAAQTASRIRADFAISQK
jgi:hypothetical protein